MKTKLLAAMALVMTIPAWSADPPAAPQPVSQTSKAPALTDDQIVAQFRTDMMSKRADIMAKGLTLTAEQASKFWPLFEELPEGTGRHRQRADRCHPGLCGSLPESERRGCARLREGAAGS